MIGIISVLYAVKTIARNNDWKDNRTLYESGMETAPDSWRANNLLAVEYTKIINEEKDPVIKQELFRKAITHFNKSAEILPNADIYLLKGYAYEFAGGQDDSAIINYAIALQLDSNNNQAANNMGAIYLRRNNFEQAIQVLSKVVAKDSTYTDALSNLAASYGNSGRLREAEHYYLKAMKYYTDPPANVLQSMSNIYRILGDNAKSQYYMQLLQQKNAQVAG